VRECFKSQAVQQFQQAADASTVDHSFAESHRLLLIAPQTALATQPSKQTLHHPTMRQADPALHPPAVDAQGQATNPTAPARHPRCPRLHPRPPCQGKLAAGDVRDAYAVHHDHQPQSQGAHLNTPLAGSGDVWTLWRSMIPALGLGRRPAFWQTCPTSTALIGSFSPLSVQRRK
jgi:hypothetical protein